MYSTPIECDESTIKRFWIKVDQSGGPDACWEWIGARHYKGYGLFSVNRAKKKAHRVAFTIINGSIPSGMVICHQCDNASCCNPAHLFLGTQSDNIKDAVDKERIFPPNANKLTDVDVRSIREKFASGRITKTQLAQDFNVSMRTIREIISYQKRRNII